MPQTAWNARRERQYAHIRDSLLQRGEKEELADEIAARTFNKQRAQHGEAAQASASSLNDMPAGRRGGLHSHAARKAQPWRSCKTRPGSAA
jgi:hypothetical protein